jgi:hypothetical protein
VVILQPCHLALLILMRAIGCSIKSPRQLLASFWCISIPSFVMFVTTRQQAYHTKKPHAASHLNLNNLPAEIIEQIAFHLNPDSKDPHHTANPARSDDFDDDQMSFFSDYAADKTRETKVIPCCQFGEENVDASEPSIPILDARSIFSATSKRIRDVVWNRRQTKRKNIRYCDQWILETRHVSEETRSRYT